MSFTLRCDNCSNDIEMFDIVDTGRKLRVHPGSVQRYRRFGQLDGTSIQRGLYFTAKQIGEFKPEIPKEVEAE